MTYNKSFLSMTLAAALALSSCSGLPKGNGGGGGGGGGSTGNTLLNITVTTTPSQTFSFPSLNWQIVGLSLTNSAGTTVSLLSAASPFLDFARLQTDSAYLGNTSIASTSYTSMQVRLNASLSDYFYNSTNASLLGCAPGTVCLIPSTVPGFGAATINVPITYTAAASANAGLRINFDLSRAVTTASGMTFDFTQTGAIVVSTLPPISSQSAGLDTVDNFTGVVTAASGTSVTVQSFASPARTFTIGSGTEFDDPFTICANSGCLAVNQNISVDGVVNADGTSTATEIEVLDPSTAVNELEGVIISPVVANQFKMALSNGMGSNAVAVGAEVSVNLSGGETYFADPKDLGVSNTVTGFLSQADLVVGQTVMIQRGTFNSGTISIINPVRVLLRYSSIGGAIQTVGNPAFTLGNVSPFFNTLVSNSVETETFPATSFDNITNLGNLSVGTNASVRGLYLNPNSGATQPLLAAKVRTH
jgi:hypothetical protein